MNRDHSVIFEITFKYCISDSFVDHDGYSISSEGFLPAAVDTMVIWVKFTHPVHFSSLILRMSTFTLAISCLTTSNLPWFMDLTFHVPMQYCSLQHQILLLPPVTSTTGYCFCFGSITSFFLELFLHWSPVAYWAPNDLGSSSFGILIIENIALDTMADTDIIKCTLYKHIEKGMASHFSILALRTPWTVWKGKMIGYWQRNSPGH